jgi:hypothetical protein
MMGLATGPHLANWPLTIVHENVIECTLAKFTVA